MTGAVHNKPGYWLGDTYLGKLPLGEYQGGFIVGRTAVPEGVCIVGARFFNDRSPRWMSDEEFARLSAL